MPSFRSLVSVALLAVPLPAHAGPDIDFDVVAITAGKLVVIGRARPNVTLRVSGTRFSTRANAEGDFSFSIAFLPPNCRIGIASPSGVATAIVAGCGSQGVQGKVGPRGPGGLRGLTGPRGSQGKIGPRGPEGAQGRLGPVGPVGPIGPGGPQGPVDVAGVVDLSGPVSMGYGDDEYKWIGSPIDLGALGLGAEKGYRLTGVATAVLGTSGPPIEITLNFCYDSRNTNLSGLGPGTRVVVTSSPAPVTVTIANRGNYEEAFSNGVSTVGICATKPYFPIDGPWIDRSGSITAWVMAVSP